jgi:membrane protein
MKMLRPDDIRSLLSETFSKWTADKGPRMGAALAFYAIFSIPPLMIIALAVLTFVYSGDAFFRLQSELASLVGDSVAGTLLGSYRMQQRGGGLIAGVVGLGVLFFTASGVFVELEDALNTIWEVKPRDTGIKAMLKGRLSSFTMVLGICFLLMASLALTAIVAGLSEKAGDWVPGGGLVVGYVMDFALSVGVITLLFAMIFKVLPAVYVAWNDVWIGAAITAVLFTIGKFALGIYIGKAGVGLGYGAAGSLVILTTWVYYSAQIFLLGAEFTHVWARRRGSRRPEEDQQAPGRAA